MPRTEVNTYLLKIIIMTFKAVNDLFSFALPPQGQAGDVVRTGGDAAGANS
ncbi:MAG: hypothetical protein H0A75_06195 [Candidatus Methanofishera endochildressiae]|uniref:Uncharacterized protein n=1 Tax=Candidatus Methanofishera endochildressiae TaxID=2738884 RepID=A0A7Z0SFB8_9GAMM|nr:hypothetical protein [Candidatus Methanofishera endochildressiae]